MGSGATREWEPRALTPSGPFLLPVGHPTLPLTPAQNRWEREVGKPHPPDTLLAASAGTQHRETVGPPGLQGRGSNSLCQDTAVCLGEPRVLAWLESIL